MDSRPAVLGRHGRAETARREASAERDFGRQASEEDDEEEGQIVSEGEIEPSARPSRPAPLRSHKRSASPSPSPSREYKRPPRPGIDDRWQADSPLRDPSPRRHDSSRREGPVRGWRERPRSASREDRDWRRRQDRQRRDDGQDRQRRDDGQDRQRRDDGQDRQRRDDGQDRQRRDDGQDRQRWDDGQDRQRRDDGQDRQRWDDGQDRPRRAWHSELDRPGARHAPRESRLEEPRRRRRDDDRDADWGCGRGDSPGEWDRQGRMEEPRPPSPDSGDEEVAAQLERALEGGEGSDQETRLIEERRRRRQEILAKFKGGGENGSGETTAPAPPFQPREPSTTHLPRPLPRSTSAEDFAELNSSTLARDMADWEARAGPAASSRSLPASQALSPSQLASGTGEARDADAARRLEAHTAQAEVVLAGGGGDNGVAPARHPAQPTLPPPKEEEDDMFAATPPEVRAALAGAAAGAARARLRVAGGAALVDSFDDAEGYYQFQVGEVLAGRYEVSAALGRGVFSSVLRARDLRGGEGGRGGEGAAAGKEGGDGLAGGKGDSGGLVGGRGDSGGLTGGKGDSGGLAGSKGDSDGAVAIKVLRANDTMTKAGKMEVAILKKLADADPGGRRHCVRLLGSFEYRAHLCLVFESLDCNLRELTRRYGRGVGLSGQAVRVYAHQLLQALHHLRACGVVHADIKPDNVLVDARRTTVRLADFGSAMFAGDNPITPYLVSRFYRAPEIVLGLPYDHPLDVWSLGCVLYELLTGRILFPGKTNNEMLKLFMDLKGPFPKKMLRRAEFAARHFEDDPQQSFALVEEDAVTGRPKRTLVSNPRVRRDAAALLQDQMPDRRKLAQFADLLERMLVLDPDRRITPREALRHPFVKEPFA